MCTLFSQDKVIATFLIDSTWHGFFGNIGSLWNIAKYAVTLQRWYIGCVAEIVNTINEEMILITWSIIIPYKYQVFLVIDIWKCNLVWINMALAPKDIFSTCLLFGCKLSIFGKLVFCFVIFWLCVIKSVSAIWGKREFGPGYTGDLVPVKQYWVLRKTLDLTFILSCE